MLRINQSMYLCAVSAMFFSGFASVASSADGVDAENFGRALAYSPATQVCMPRVARMSGSQTEPQSQFLLKPGNVACVEAQYGGELRVEVSLCEGSEVELRGIAVDRHAFAEGRRRTSNPALIYELLYKNGNVSPPQSIGRGYKSRREVDFPAQLVTGVVITLFSKRNSNQVNERLCSMVFDIQ